MFKPLSERWPPVYDADDLAQAIQVLADPASDTYHFFAPAIFGPPVCQGDVVALRSPVPLIDENGEPAAVGDVQYWLVIGNTCDFDRVLEEVPWSQLVPLIDLGGASDVRESDLAALRRYQYTRRFYVPPWSEDVSGRHHIADFLRPVAIHKTALTSVAQVSARLSFAAWVLLHSCLVRFFARDDGRFAPD